MENNGNNPEGRFTLRLLLFSANAFLFNYFCNKYIKRYRQIPTVL